jgi:hypothetical protein
VGETDCYTFGFDIESKKCYLFSNVNIEPMSDGSTSASMFCFKLPESVKTCSTCIEPSTRKNACTHKSTENGYQTLIEDCATKMFLQGCIGNTKCNWNFADCRPTTVDSNTKNNFA